MLKGLHAATATRHSSRTTDALGGAGGRAAPGRAFSPIAREQPRPTAPASGPLAAPGAPAAAPDALERQLTGALERKQHIERMFDRAVRGKDASPEQLLRLQMQVNEYSVQLDTASRLVERLTSAVKQTMNTQV